MIKDNIFNRFLDQIVAFTAVIFFLYRCCDDLESASTFVRSLRIWVPKRARRTCKDVLPCASDGTAMFDCRRIGSGGCRLRTRLK